MCRAIPLLLAMLLSLPALSHALAGTWKSFPYIGSSRDLIAKGDSLWIATGGGLALLNTRTGEWRTLRQPDGLPGVGVSALHFDRTGALWTGLDSGAYSGVRAGDGVARLDGDIWTAYKGEEVYGMYGTVEDVTSTPDGSFWFATYSGAVRFDGSSWRVFDTKDGLAENRLVGAACAPDGAVWFCHPYYRNGLARFDGDSWTKCAPDSNEFAQSYLRGMAVDHAGAVWLAMGGAAAS